ncbi:MAG: PIN domain-containing protein [Nanoarchaeota archaeon]|nr:PIN domain-containing protein [Nanoarchaeota archaeon]MBU0978138.1 PIN domain-containing protein [Nanoarchaeota archaeon]
MKCLIGSSLWIEYLAGSKLGERVNQILKANNEIFSLPIIVSEVVSKVERNNSNSEIAYESIIKNAKLFEITPRVAKEAGIIHASMKKKVKNFPLADAIIVCAAKALKAKILTCDAHFKPFSEAEVW